GSVRTHRVRIVLKVLIHLLLAGALLVSGLFFFFSSRRRHTSFSRDWSSDVCSSDLDDREDGTAPPRVDDAGGVLESRRHRRRVAARSRPRGRPPRGPAGAAGCPWARDRHDGPRVGEGARASWATGREREKNHVLSRS